MGLTTTIVPAGETHSTHVADLRSILTSSPHSFLQPTENLHAAAVLAAKQLLDPLASEIAHAQLARRIEHRRKRKRGQDEVRDAVLPIREIHTAGFGTNQIWEQAKRVIDAATQEAEEVLRSIASQQARGISPAIQNGHHDAYTEDVAFEEDLQEDVEAEDEEKTDSDANEMMANSTQSNEDHDEAEEEFGEDIEVKDKAQLADRNDERPPTYVSDPHGLNDGFFSIDDFNKHSQFLEQMDARGDDDNPGDEDEIDWDANPLATPFAGTKPAGSNEDEQEDDEGGPIPGDTNLNAPGSDDNMDDGGVELDDVMPGLDNTNDIRYADFFEPPAKKPSKAKRMRALPKTQPPKSTARNEDVEGDMERAMADVRRDLLDSESEMSDDEPDDDEVDAAKRDGTVAKEKVKNLSTHEKQRAAIAIEIRKLEVASVAKRDWTLSGEARAADRPVNSLIEEDLEFERAGKPVPVITAEVSEEIEALIKRRIIAREFDEVVRRRPDTLGSTSETRRGRVEVDDEKSKIGLGEVYEQEHLKSTDPNFIDSRSKATKKAHEEIDRLWKDVSAQLDLLSNLHFKPKRAEVEIKSVEDKPTISMQDARPVGDAGENMLAPQEIYRAGDDKGQGGEVISKGGARVSKEEMTREEKLRRRRRDKERAKKATGNQAVRRQLKEGGMGKKSKKEEKSDVLTQLRKGNVKVIGKTGKMEELGKQKSTEGVGDSSSALKL